MKSLNFFTKVKFDISSINTGSKKNIRPKLGHGGRGYIHRPMESPLNSQNHFYIALRAIYRQSWQRMNFLQVVDIHSQIWCPSASHLALFWVLWYHFGPILGPKLGSERIFHVFILNYQDQKVRLRLIVVYIYSVGDSMT